ncbi:MAG: gamma-glutamyl-gamma-aminobutyrate hydrolase family protein [Alistipes sp.]|nr:gamma-glutamyl-gamma-aminobutyrate hydrolase family protein [Candidatus Minthomonas equi]
MSHSTSTTFITLITSIGFITGCIPSTNNLPTIGISPCGNPEHYSMTSPMFTSVFHAGGVPLMLPMVRSEKEANALIEKIDGLIMVGGEDINPAYYDENIWNETVKFNPFRDTSDFLLLNAARKKGIPLLGICRGEQILNIACGGSLYQDIPSQIGEHKIDTTNGHNTHMLFIEKGTHLHALLGVDSVMVNSFHHQAVKTAGKGLKVSAHARDGVVEAYEGNSIMGVQFHPELFIASGDTTFLPIFRDFVNKASENR